MASPFKSDHPKGEFFRTVQNVLPEAVEVDTFAGKLQVEWDPHASVTPMGQLPFFILISDQVNSKFYHYRRDKAHFGQVSYFLIQ